MARQSISSTIASGKPQQFHRRLESNLDRSSFRNRNVSPSPPDFLDPLPFPLTDACWPAPMADALISRRALCEPFNPSTSSGLRTDSASWSALLNLVSVQSNEDGRGVTLAQYVSKSATVIGSFCRTKVGPYGPHQASGPHPNVYTIRKAVGQFFVKHRNKSRNYFTTAVRWRGGRNHHVQGQRSNRIRPLESPVAMAFVG